MIIIEMLCRQNKGVSDQKFPTSLHPIPFCRVIMHPETLQLHDKMAHGIIDFTMRAKREKKSSFVLNTLMKLRSSSTRSSDANEVAKEIRLKWDEVPHAPCERSSISSLHMCLFCSQKTPKCQIIPSRLAKICEYLMTTLFQVSSLIIFHNDTRLS